MTTVRGLLAGGAGLLGLALSFALAAGCGRDGDGPDPADRYPLRSDRLVIATPSVPVAGPAAPGQRDEAIAALPSGSTVLDPAALPGPQREQLRQALDELFGTPAAPTVAVPDRPAELPGLSLSPDTLAAGAKVYRRLCGQCHGATGDGRGPTGPWVYPYPRDFRTGLFKAAVGRDKPRVEGLVRLIRHGVPGTSMQPFDLIPEDDLRAVTAYTVHLSARGETEFVATKALLDDGGDDVAELARRKAAWVMTAWVRVQGKVPAGIPELPPGDPADPAYQASVRRGYEQFVGVGGAGCAKCHQDFGRADFYQYDAWGLAVRASDLTRGEYRWGREPADLAARVRHGIPGANMPANPLMTDGQVRDVVNFVRELPFPNRLPADVRESVYPPGR